MVIFFMKLGSTPRQPVASPPPFVCSHSQKRCILSPLFATLTHSASRKSFPCHSHENTRDIRLESESQAKLTPESLYGQGLCPSRRQHDHNVSREGAGQPSPRSWCTLSVFGEGPLSPFDRTLTKNAPVTPLFLTLTKSLDLKSHRIILLRTRGGAPYLQAHTHGSPSPGRESRVTGRYSTHYPLGFVPLQCRAYGARIRQRVETVPLLPVSKPVEQDTGYRGSRDVQPGFRWV